MPMVPIREIDPPSIKVKPRTVLGGLQRRLKLRRAEVPD
jgi:hypothetical protein